MSEGTNPNPVVTPQRKSKSGTYVFLGLIFVVLIIIGTIGLFCEKERQKKENSKSKEIATPREELAKSQQAQKSAQPSEPKYSKNLYVELKPGEPYTIDKVKRGQKWHYATFTGVFYHRVDKGDNKACWKEVKNNLPWQADWDGDLQVKAGNMPVSITVSISD